MAEGVHVPPLGNRVEQLRRYQRTRAEALAARGELVEYLQSIVGQNIDIVGFPRRSMYVMSPDPKTGRQRLGSCPVYSIVDDSPRSPMILLNRRLVRSDEQSFAVAAHTDDIMVMEPDFQPLAVVRFEFAIESIHTAKQLGLTSLPNLTCGQEHRHDRLFGETDLNA